MNENLLRFLFVVGSRSDEKKGWALTNGMPYPEAIQRYKTLAMSLGPQNVCLLIQPPVHVEVIAHVPDDWAQIAATHLSPEGGR